MATQPALSVVLPVYNAMPYLTVCIRDVLRQEVEGGLELICAWDGGDVDAWEFLVEVAQRCGRVEVVDAPATPTSSKPSAASDVPAWAPSQNPACSAAPRHDEDADHPAIERSPCEPLSADAVAQACAANNALRVVKYRDGLNRGQGAAMSLALA